MSGDDAETHLLALRDWLALEDALRGRLELRGSAPESGHMGVALDVVAVALGPLVDPEEPSVSANSRDS